MKLACFAHQFVMHGMNFSDLLVACRAAGVDALELGVANRTATPGMAADELLSSPSARDELMRSLDAHGLEIAALNCFGNPLHPDESVARAEQDGIEMSVRLAAQLGVRTVVTASGCPGDGRWPIWITWPLYWEDLEGPQWEAAGQVWTRLAHLARELGVEICIELHPGQLVYNTSSFLRLAALAGPALRANLDPAHLFYQGMDPLAVARALGRHLGHVHAKDTAINAAKIALDGVLDTSPLDRVDRAWRYVAVGDGHGIAWWRDFLTAIDDAGFDGAVSIEHEDAALDGPEALRRNTVALRAAGLGA